MRLLGLLPNLSLPCLIATAAPRTPKHCRPHRTRYKHHFPFLDPSLRLKTANRLWCDSLHEGIVFPDCPKLMYIGMQDQWFTFNMFDAQVCLGDTPT